MALFRRFFVKSSEKKKTRAETVPLTRAVATAVAKKLGCSARTIFRRVAAGDPRVCGLVKSLRPKVSKEERALEKITREVDDLLEQLALEKPRA